MTAGIREIKVAEFLISDAKKWDQSAFLGASNLNVASLWPDYNLSSSISLTFKFYLPALKSGIYSVILSHDFELPLHFTLNCVRGPNGLLEILNRELKHVESSLRGRNILHLHC